MSINSTIKSYRVTSVGSIIVLLLTAIVRIFFEDVLIRILEKTFTEWLYDNMLAITIILLLFLTVLFLIDQLTKCRTALNATKHLIHDMDAKQVVKYFQVVQQYETITEVETELTDAAANMKIQIWGMGRDSTAYLPIPPEIFKDHILVFREHALESIANLNAFGLNADLIKSGGIVIHGRKQTIAYACILFSEKQIKSTKWSDRSPK